MQSAQLRQYSQMAWLLQGRMRPFSTAIVALATLLFVATQQAAATYTDLIGFPQLQDQLGTQIPTGLGISVQHVEGVAGGAQAGNYAPNPIESENLGKTFNNITFNSGVSQGSTGISNHARGVGFYFYGNSRSVSPGIDSIDIFEANHWMGFQVNGTSATAHSSGFLNTLGGAPNTTSARIANHSWVGEFGTSSVNSQVVRRLDYVVERDDLVNVVGIQNGFANGDRSLLKSAFNDISVGVTNADHYVYTLGIDGTYTDGRVAPDIVAPGLNLSNSVVRTSSATPMVSSVAALLLDAASDSEISNGSVTNRTRTINHAETSEVIKAVLMAGADRAVDNINGPDLLDYAVDTSNNLDLDYGAGQVNVLHSYNILAAGEHDSDQDRGSAVDISNQGWDYDTNFGGENATNDRGSYHFTASKSGDVLHATLAWNIEVQGFTSSASNTTLRDLNLVLYDVTNSQVVNETGASSLSTTENTENIFFDGLVAGNRYEIRVEAANGQSDFDWDYALAWRIESWSTNQVPEPSAVGLTILGVLTFLGSGRFIARKRLG